MSPEISYSRGVERRCKEEGQGSVRDVNRDEHPRCQRHRAQRRQHSCLKILIWVFPQPMGHYGRANTVWYTGLCMLSVLAEESPELRVRQYHAM